MVKRTYAERIAFSIEWNKRIAAKAQLHPRMKMPKEVRPVVIQDAWTRMLRRHDIKDAAYMYQLAIEEMRFRYPQVMDRLPTLIKHCLENQRLLQGHTPEQINELVYNQVPELMKSKDDLLSGKESQRFIKKFLFGRSHAGFFVRLLTDAAKIDTLTLDRLRGGELLKIPRSTRNKGVSRSDRELRKRITMALSVWTYVDEPAINNAAKLHALWYFEFNKSLPELHRAIREGRIEVTHMPKDAWIYESFSRWHKRQWSQFEPVLFGRISPAYVQDEEQTYLDIA
tara:strand:- start:3656 stop:4507 length:852 start_codon:yes stop_codon:yes gene_type:complete